MKYNFKKKFQRKKKTHLYLKNSEKAITKEWHGSHSKKGELFKMSPFRLIRLDLPGRLRQHFERQKISQF